MKLPRLLALGLASGLALAVAAVGTAAPAHAEPVATSFAMVGSDTLQDATNALTNGTRLTGSLVRVAPTTGPIGNFDAFGSAMIQTKPGGSYFKRPAGSGDGRNALISSITGAPWNGVTITGEVDIARSSSGPGGNANSAGRLAYVPFGRDAVAYAYRDANGDLARLTTAQLKSIYEANSPVTIGSTVVKPLLPQSGSGTRQFFLAAIGVTAVGSQVDTFNNTLPENDGSVITQVGQIVPFSAANWIAQSNRAGLNTIPATGEVKLGSPNGISPFTGTGTSLSPSPAFYASSYGRDTYLIVEFARINPTDPKFDPALARLVDPTRNDSLTYFSGPGLAGIVAIKKRFGFEAPSSQSIIRAYPNI